MHIAQEYLFPHRPINVFAITVRTKKNCEAFHIVFLLFCCADKFHGAVVLLDVIWMSIYT